MIKKFKQFINENLNSDETEEYMNGKCIPFVVALNEIFPEYNIAVLNDEFDDVDEDSEYNFNFVHTFCYNPNNHKIIIDALGVRKLNDLYDDYHDINPSIDWDIPNSKYLIDNFAGKSFASEESFEYDISEYEEAKEFILKNLASYKL